MHVCSINCGMCYCMYESIIQSVSNIGLMSQWKVNTVTLPNSEFGTHPDTAMNAYSSKLLSYIVSGH